jgi:flagellar basal body P-ring formation protein FlgA
MRALLLALCLAFAAPAFAAPAVAASVRPLVVLSGAQVRLSDLFDDAGPLATRVLGTGPGPGGRIVVEEPQLAAIARQFRVDWDPIPGARVVLERPGRPLPREAVMAALGPALIAAGAPSDSEIELSGYDAPLVATDANVGVTVGEMDYDVAAGRFTADLIVTDLTMDPIHLRLAGRVLEMAELPVPTHRLDAGTPITADDLQVQHVRAPTGTPLLRTIQDAVGLAPRLALPPGQPIVRAVLQVVPLVRKGDPVRLDLDITGLSLTAMGVALEPAAEGAELRVRNPASGAVVQAVVTGPDEARVLPGSLPLQKGFR